MIRVAIGGKSKTLLSHLTSDPPDQESEEYEQWEQEDLIVFSWLIQNIEPTVASIPLLKHYGTLWWSLTVAGEINYKLSIFMSRPMTSNKMILLLKTSGSRYKGFGEKSI